MKRLRLMITRLMLFLLCLFSLPSYAANCVSLPLSCPPLNLQQQPIILLNTASATAPNIMFIMDNSSTMGTPTGAKATAAKNAYKWIMDSYPNFRYGLEYLSRANDDYANTTLTPLFRAIPSTNAAMKTAIDGWVEYSGTPMYLATIRAAKYFGGRMGLPSPIISNCQKNYLVIVTDGKWKNKDPDRTIVDYAVNYAIEKSDPVVLSGDIDRDGDNRQYADLIRYFYVNKLYPPVQGANEVPNPYLANLDHPSFKNNLRLFYIHLYQSDPAPPPPPLVLGADGWPDPHLDANSNVWGGSPGGGGALAPRGFWHATWNSAGTYVRIVNPSAPDFESLLKTAFDSFFQTLISANYSAVPAAQNTTTLNTGAQVYQSSLNSSTWTGNLFSYPISTTGVISSTATWSAACKLDGGTCSNPSGTNPGKAFSSRVIITRNWLGTQTGVAFRWPIDYVSPASQHTLYVGSTNMTNFLSNAPYAANTTTAAQITANDVYGKKLVDYLRGDATNERKNSGGIFRDRLSKLGDIVDSSPAYVGPPNGPYADTSESANYSSFKSAYATRTPIIYVGANDGMLHGFNANTGDEIFAYVPGDSEIFKNLSQLSLSPYNHKFFSNASPIIGDAFFKGGWRTILVSALGNGGKSIYALEITDPALFTEAQSDINKVYLFEFSNAVSDDVGYIQGTPTIAKVRKDATTHQWAIIFGNGYNSSTATTGSGKAALYILLIDAAVSGGNVVWTPDVSFIKIPVGVGDRSNPNGLSTPYAFDKDDNGVIDYVYAGDLQGNMWRFDLTDNIPVNWKTKASLLFTAKKTATGDQPITAPPVVGAHPNGIANGVLVYFGTGRFLEPTDNTITSQTTQTFYGIWDTLTTNSPSAAIVNKTSLLQQSILGTQTTSAGTFRLMSSNSIDWNTHLGWYFDLVVGASNGGERQVSTPILHNNRVVFTTLIPPDPSTGTCDTPSILGKSWLMEVSSENGGTPPVTTFDSNNDGLFTSTDVITVGASTGFAAGYQSTVGITGSPTIFISADGLSETKVMSGKGLGTVKENPMQPAIPTGRRENWRQINY